MRVLLTMAPCRRLQFNLSDMYPVPRLGIGYLAAYVERHGVAQVDIVDMIAERMWTDDLVAYMRHYGPYDVIGISTTILSLREAFDIAKAVKRAFPGTATVVGGPGITYDAQGLLRFGADVDYFVRGEGEIPFLALLRTLRYGGSLEAVPQLIWRCEGLAKENQPGQFRDLDDGIDCAYDKMPMHKYKLHPPHGIYPYATLIEATRGCSFPCEFCCLKISVRYRDPASIEQEVRRLIQRYAVRELFFTDPTFTLHRARTIDIAERLGRLGIHWSCMTRVDLIDPELAGIMARNGCYYLAFGVESGDDTILTNIDKKANASESIATFRTCRKLGIRTTAYMLVGNPGESNATVDHSIKFVRKLQPDYVLYGVVYPDPGNELTRKGLEQGLFTQEDLYNYYLSDNPSQLESITVAGHPMELAQTWLKRASSDFYLRPQYFWQRVRDLRTIQDAVNLGIGGSTFLKDFYYFGKLWEKIGSH